MFGKLIFNLIWPDGTETMGKRELVETKNRQHFADGTQ